MLSVDLHKKLINQRREKIARFCSVSWDHIISAPDADSIYDIPDMFEEQQFATNVLKEFGLQPRQNDLSAWKVFTDKVKNASETIKIGVVGKIFFYWRFYAF